MCLLEIWPPFAPPPYSKPCPPPQYSKPSYAYDPFANARGVGETEHGSYACTGDNSFAKARGLSLSTGGRTVLYQMYHDICFERMYSREINHMRMN